MLFETAIGSIFSFLSLKKNLLFMDEFISRYFVEILQ